MVPHTYTLIIKVSENTSSTEMLQIVYRKMKVNKLDGSVQLGRVFQESREALMLLHTEDNSDKYGRVFSEWMGEKPLWAPFPEGALLWYN